MGVPAIWCGAGGFLIGGNKMSIPESIPEDEKESYPCECGGNIIQNEDGLWECDSCDWKPGDNKKDKTN